MQARSALLDLYGDHLRSRGGHAPVAAVVRLLDAVGVAAPAARTAISRMVRQGWLEPFRCDAGPGYQLTPVASRRLDEAAARVYRTVGPWDGTWHIVIVPRPEDRGVRDRVRNAFAVLGFSQLADGTFIGPRASTDLRELLDTEGLVSHEFEARHLGLDKDLIARAWDLDALAADYLRWINDAQAITALAGPRADDERCYAVRSRLVHEWRKFLHTDPGLPRDLLPTRWPGETAAAFFDEQAGRLMPAASRFVDACVGDYR